MTRAIDNLGARRGARAAALVVPLVAGTLALAGVVAPPAIDLARSGDALERIRARAEAFGRESDAIRAFESARGLERIADAEARVESALPLDAEPFAVQSLVRLVACARAIELSAIRIGHVRDGGLAVLDDRVVLREVVVEGSGALAGWTGLLEDLDAHGRPAVVLDFDLRRANGPGRAFEARMTLGFLATAPAIARDDDREDAP